jgi:hypothetical protein
MTDNTKKKSGGKRVGAGRKPKGTASKIQVSYWLDPEVVSIIRLQPNQAEFLESAVREKHKIQGDNAELP